MSKRLFISIAFVLTLAVTVGFGVGSTSVALAAPAQDPGNPGNQDTNGENKKPGENKQNGALENKDGENRDPVTEKTVKESSVVDYISAAYNWLAIIGGLLAVIMLIYAGYSYMGSNGDPEKISNSKDIVEKALLGLGLLIIATVLLRAVNPRTVDPCTPGDRGCGAIDFTKPDGGVKDNTAERTGDQVKEGADNIKEGADNITDKNKRDGN